MAMTDRWTEKLKKKSWGEGEKDRKLPHASRGAATVPLYTMSVFYRNITPCCQEKRRKYFTCLDFINKIYWIIIDYSAGNSNRQTKH